MSQAKNLISAMALAMALAPMVGAAAFTYGAAQDAGNLAGPTLYQAEAGWTGHVAKWMPVTAKTNR